MGIDARTKKGREQAVLNKIRECGERGIAYWVFDNRQWRAAFMRLQDRGTIIVTPKYYPYWGISINV